MDHYREIQSRAQRTTGTQSCTIQRVANARDDVDFYSKAVDKCKAVAYVWCWCGMRLKAKTDVNSTTQVCCFSQVTVASVKGYWHVLISSVYEWHSAFLHISSLEFIFAIHLSIDNVNVGVRIMLCNLYCNSPYLNGHLAVASTVWFECI